MTTAFEVHGACALVTGASRGIGCEIARQLAKAGAHVALTARTAEPLQALAAELRAHGVRAVPIAGDLGRVEDRERIVAAAEKELGAIDVLVNNAAIESEGPFTDLSLRAILRTRSRTSRPTAGRPGDLPRLESHLQYSAKPARCHLITVSGLTIATASDHRPHAP